MNRTTATNTWKTVYKLQNNSNDYFTWCSEKHLFLSMLIKLKLKNIAFGLLWTIHIHAQHFNKLSNKTNKNAIKKKTKENKQTES